MILSPKLFSNSWGNSYIKFSIIDIKFRFICCELKLYKIIEMFQNIMTSIVGSLIYC